MDESLVAADAAESPCGCLREASGLPEVVIQGDQYRRGDVLSPLVENQVVTGGQLDQPLLGRHQSLVDQAAVAEGEQGVTRRHERHHRAGDAAVDEDRHIGREQAGQEAHWVGSASQGVPVELIAPLPLREDLVDVEVETHRHLQSGQHSAGDGDDPPDRRVRHAERVGEAGDRQGFSQGREQDVVRKGGSDAVLAAGGQQGEDAALARPHQPDGAAETGAGIVHRVPDVSDHVVEGEPVDDPGAAPMRQRVDADHVVAVPADRVQEGAVEQGVGHGSRDEHNRRRRVLLRLPDGQRDGSPARFDRDLRVAGQVD
mgnify:CR=1 FL=1